MINLNDKNNARAPLLRVNPVNNAELNKMWPSSFTEASNFLG